jgi:hypothetical protein
MVADAPDELKKGDEVTMRNVQARDIPNTAPFRHLLRRQSEALLDERLLCQPCHVSDMTCEVSGSLSSWPSTPRAPRVNRQVVAREIIHWMLLVGGGEPRRPVDRDPDSGTRARR